MIIIISILNISMTKYYKMLPNINNLLMVVLQKRYIPQRASFHNKQKSFCATQCTDLFETQALTI